MTCSTKVDVISPRVGSRHWDAMLDALDRLDGCGPEFGGFLANHGPMAADALSRLGAPDVVARWVDAYRDQLEGAPAVGHRIGDDNWREHLGDLRFLGDWTSYFDGAVRRDGWRDVVTTWWPRLLPGAAASAAHGLIRTAHAIRSVAAAPRPHELLSAELARSLAFWAARYQPLPGAPTLLGSRSAVDALVALPRLSPEVPSVGPGFSGRLAALVALPDLPDALDAWGVDSTPEAALDELISAAARTLVSRDDHPLVFCHAVTAPAAVQMVLDEIPGPLRAPTVAAVWTVVGGLVAAYAWGPAHAEMAEQQHAAIPSVHDLAAKAIEHGDDHVLKLTEAAIRQYTRTSDTALLLAADRFRQRSTPR